MYSTACLALRISMPDGCTCLHRIRSSTSGVSAQALRAMYPCPVCTSTEVDREKGAAAVPKRPPASGSNAPPLVNASAQNTLHAR